MTRQSGQAARQDHASMGDIAARAAGGAIFMLCIGFLAFVVGSTMTVAEIPPTEYMRIAYKAGVAYVHKQLDSGDPLESDLWREARTQERGVTTAAADKAYGGYTLYTSGDGPYAALIDMEGNRVHEWRRPFSEIWDETAAVTRPQPDELTYMRKAKALPNGDLLAIYVSVGDTPWGYGMVRLDRDSQVIWRYLEPTHHDFDVAPDGRIYGLLHEVTTERITPFRRLGRPRLTDSLVVLSPDGEEIRRVSLTHALARSRYATLLHAAPYFASEDPMHTNAVEYIDAEKAAVFPYGEEGQVMLSFREPGLIAVLDVETEEITWATRGSWLGQHDPDILANGNILLFDNLGVFGGHGKARVMEIDPRTVGTVWSYTGSEAQPFQSDVRAAADRLPNGNTLITESDGGRLFEVTPAGEIVWEFHNPVRAGEGDSHVPVVSWGQRIAPDAFDPDFLSTITKRGS